MKDRIANILMLCLLLFVSSATAQKPFDEGIIEFNVTLSSADNHTFQGVYTFYIKDGEIRKELKLDNGYHDITLIDCKANKVYTLQSGNGKDYAIELSMDDLIRKQLSFRDFSLSSEKNTGNQVSGYSVYKGTVTYKDGFQTDILYTREWRPAQAVTFNRFPGASFMPLRFFYKEESGISMIFEVVNIEAGPVASSLFRIPAEYKMISYEEYKQLRKG
jgi:hypothetical protein